MEYTKYHCISCCDVLPYSFLEQLGEALFGAGAPVVENIPDLTQADIDLGELEVPE